MANRLLSVSSFCKYFIHCPDSILLSEQDQAIVTLASYVIRTISCRVAPKLCRYYWGICEVWSDAEKKVVIERLKEQILKAPNNPSRDEEVEEIAFGTAYHRMFDGLWLGNKDSFVEAKNQNELGIETVITLCPIEHEWDEIENSFQKRRMEWLYLGDKKGDILLGWLPFVHDSTYVQTGTFSARYSRKEDIATQALKYRQKVEKIREQPVTAWFAPVFAKIDEAIFGSRKILIHCQTGSSKSSSILAAYLISRFNVTAEQAIAYISHIRACARPEFTPELMEYEKALNKERVLSAIR